MNCNAVKIVEGMWKKVNPRFDASIIEFQELAQAYPGKFELMRAAFTFGYAQGQKAERARRKRGASHE